MRIYRAGKNRCNDAFIVVILNSKASFTRQKEQFTKRDLTVFTNVNAEKHIVKDGIMSSKKQNLYEFEGFHVNLSERTLWFEDEPVSLAPKVLETLCVLVENQGRLMTKDELMNEIWADTFVEERNLTQNIFTLRKIFKEKGKKGKVIETVPRRGYRFVAELAPVEIQTQETLQISHTKQMRVSAEGFVSKRELAEVVKEVTKNLIAENENATVQTKRIETEKNGFVSAKPFTKILILPVVLVLAIGVAAFWFWQNGFFKYHASSFDAETLPVLDFKRLTDSGKAFFPTISPDKKFVAYVHRAENKWSIRVKNIAAGSETTAVEPTDKGITNPHFSADGNYLYYFQNEVMGGIASINKVSIFGGSPRTIVRDLLTDPLLSPDGSRLAFVRILPETGGQQLVVCSTENCADQKVVAERRKPEHFDLWNFRHSWSPDGTKILVGIYSEPTKKTPKGSGQFVAVNIADGSFEPVKLPKWNNFFQAKWMPDGKSIMFLAREKANSPYQIWQVAYPTGEAGRITNDTHDYRYLSIAPDGEFLLTTQEKEIFNLYEFPLSDASKIEQLTSSSESKHGTEGVYYSPDGNEIVYSLIESVGDSNIWAINAETKEKRQITFDEAAVNRYPKVTTDGKSVVFMSNRKNGFHIWQVDLDGTNLRQLTDGIGEAFPNISADGKWLIYVSPGNAPTAIWKKSLTNDENPVKLFEGAAGDNSISDDGRQLLISYFGKGVTDEEKYRYGLIPFEPTKEIKDVGFNPASVVAKAWKPDGSGFYYIDREIVVNNLWFYSIADGSKKRITNFDDLQISHFSLSPDGQNAAVSRGSTVSNILKISGF